MRPEIADMLAQGVVSSIRGALLDGDVVTVPGVGRLEIRVERKGGLVHPANGETIEFGGRRTVVYTPDRTLLRELNGR